jgi:hypothetical protein
MKFSRNLTALPYLRLPWICEKWNGGGVGCLDWIYLARDKDRWRTVVKAVMNLRGIS